jgi:FMN reductase
VGPAESVVISVVSPTPPMARDGDTGSHISNPAAVGPAPRVPRLGMPVRLIVMVGNPKPRSRTLSVAELVAARVAAATGAMHYLTVDLCEYAGEVFRWPHEGLSALSATVASADVLVVASPTYKGAYTGLLKSFLDRYPSGGLAGVTAIPVMTGSDPLHGMAPDFTLRPLLVELGASVPTQGLFFLISQMCVAEKVIGKWAEANLTRDFGRNARTGGRHA